MADEIVDIAPTGDILLIVGEADNIKRFTVNSAALRMASKVFEAMLSPKYAEGQALATNSTSPCEIKLEDDDPKCMGIVLDFIHLRHNSLPQRVDSDDIVSFAALVDKYFLHEALKLGLDQWLIPGEHDDCHKFLQAAIILGHAESVKKTTEMMILVHTTSYSTETCAHQDTRSLHFICGWTCFHFVCSYGY